MTRTRALLAVLAVTFATGALAQDLPPLAGPVVLTVSGLDRAQFPDGTLALDLAMLKAMGATRFTTGTMWTDGAHAYTGVLLKTLEDRLHVGNHDLRLFALNDYAVEIPADDITDEAPILAYAMDDAPMPVRDKGPLWVLYPFDSNAKYRTDTTFARSIWQLDRIEVLQ